MNTIIIRILLDRWDENQARFKTTCAMPSQGYEKYVLEQKAIIEAIRALIGQERTA